MHSPMAGPPGPRYYLRRMKSLASSPAFKLLVTGLCLFTGFRWVLRHNHDGEVKVISIEVDDEEIDWTGFYYAMFVRSERELCEAVMGWSGMEEIGSRAQRVMFYPEDWDRGLEEGEKGERKQERIERLLTAAEELFVELSPLPALSRIKTWTRGLEKGTEGLDPRLLAFNLTEYSRVLVLSPDALLLQNLDELFLFPDAPIAMPWVYHEHGKEEWDYDTKTMLIRPSTKDFQSLLKSHSSSIAPPTPRPEPALKLLHRKFGSKILRIPQRPYHLTTSEFRRDDHTPYLAHNSLSTPNEAWDPDDVLDEAKILHYHDPGFPKPWFKAERGLMNRYMPACRVLDGFGASDCRDRHTWLGLYRGFGVGKTVVCGADFEEVEVEGGKGER
ncbi:hypothetical protein HYFRA_00012594, partial [Hymenoscyphus fraxineus]